MMVSSFVFLFLLLPLAQVAGQESSSLRGSNRSPPLQVLVFDAGSSGTRIHVFNLLIDEDTALVPRIDLTVKERQTKKVKPGLSSYAEKNDYPGAEKSIAELIEFANDFVPPERRSQTPVLLKATAGLRAVKPATKAEAVLDRVRETLLKSGYLFRPEWAAIIRGKEEAGLAWVAANYLKGSLNVVPDGRSSMGVIEMGGGSTQVTFEVGSAEASRIVDEDKFTFTNLAGTPFHLYAHSYLGYGMDHAQAKLRSLIPTSEAEDPCYPSGYIRPISDQSAEATRIIAGRGNADACQELIKRLLLSPSQDSAPGVYSREMSLRGRFVGTENFFYVRNDLKIPLDGRLPAMKEAAKAACEASISPSEEEEAAMRDGSADPYKHKGCFGLSYQAALLETLKAAGAPGVEVDIARTINGGDIDWALGAALTHFIDLGMHKQAMGSSGDSLWSRLAILLLMVAAAGGALRFCGGKKQVAAVTSAVRAATMGRSGWIEVATSSQRSTK
jgi:hypothetical protein